MTGLGPRTPSRLALVVATCAALACGGESSQGTGGAGTTTGAGGGTATGGAGGSTPTGGGGAAPQSCDDPTYSTVPVVECDLFTQDCPPGSACEPVAQGNDFVTRCVQESGVKPVMAKCAKHAECQAGLYCVFGSCTPVCCPSTNEPCNGGTCNTEVSFGNHVATVCSFLVACELFTPDACAPPAQCHVLKSQGVAVCVDPAANQVSEGAKCTYVNDCGDMQTCYPPGDAASVCRYLCDLGGGAQPGLGGCPATQTCLALPTGIAGVGVCQP